MSAPTNQNETNPAAAVELELAVEVLEEVIAPGTSVRR